MRQVKETTVNGAARARERRSGPREPDYAGASATELLVRYRREGDVRLRNEAVKASMGLVSHLALRHSGRGLTRDDLMSEGAAALVAAAEGFAGERGCSFTTYAWKIVEGRMRGALSAQNALISVPPEARREASRRRAEEAAYFAAHGRSPSRGEPCGGALPRLGIPAACAMEEGVDPAATTASPSRGPEGAELLAVIRGALGSLPAPAEPAVRMRFGLDDGKGKSWEEIAAHLGVSRREAERVVSRALRVLRQRFTDDEQRCVA